MKIFKILSFTLFAFVLTGCGGSSNDSVVVIDDSVIVEPTMVTLSGTVATGVAVAGAEIMVTNKDGNEIDVTAVTDANGNYSVEFSDSVPAPVLITVLTTSGEELSAIVDDPSTEVANINPITSYVADTILASTDLSAVTAGDVSSAGQEAVTSLFGAGAQYDAFASDTFIAKSGPSDFDTQVSTADVLLDSINELAGTTDVAAFIAQTAEADSTLLDSPEFIVSVATNLALVEGTETNIEEVFDLQEIDAQLTTQLSNVALFQAVAEEVITSVEASGLTEEQEIAASSALLEIIADYVLTDDVIDLATADTVSMNVVDNLLDDIVTVVTSDEVATLTSEELIATARDSADKITTVIVDAGLDLTTDDTDFSAVEEDLSEAVIIENATDWNNGKWDTLTWQ